MGINKHIRFFISSTFADMERERELLVNEILPDLSHEYSLTQGWSIDWVDFRWGVSKKDALNHSTMDVCLRTLEKCREINRDAFMIVLLGQRYGWIPLPEKLLKLEHSIIKLQGYGKLLSKIYKLDENNLANEVYSPWWKFWRKKDSRELLPVWVMKPLDEIEGGDETIEKAFKEFNIIAETLKQSRMAREYLGDSEVTKLFCSATEQEIITGINANGVSNSVVVYQRTLTDIPKSVSRIFDPEEGRLSQNAIIERVNNSVDVKNRVWFKGDFGWYQSSDWESSFKREMELRLRHVIDNAIRGFKRDERKTGPESDTDFAAKISYSDAMDLLKQNLRANRRGLTKPQLESVQSKLHNADLTLLYVDLLGHYLHGVSSWQTLPDFPLTLLGMVDSLIDNVRCKISYPEYIVRLFVTAIAVCEKGIQTEKMIDFFEIEPNVESILRSFSVMECNGRVPLSFVIRMSDELDMLISEREYDGEIGGSVLKSRNATIRNCVITLSKSWPSPVRGESLFEYVMGFGLR